MPSVKCGSSSWRRLVGISQKDSPWDDEGEGEGGGVCFHEHPLLAVTC